MRTLLRISMDVEAANESVRKGTLEKVINSVMELIQPEAAYFTTEHGKRTAYVFFDLKDSSMIPQIAEPLFEAFRAEIEFKPVMNREDLAKGFLARGKAPKAA